MNWDCLQAGCPDTANPSLWRQPAGSRSPHGRNDPSGHDRRDASVLGKLVSLLDAPILTSQSALLNGFS